MKTRGLYTKNVMEHFKAPHNWGKLKNADGVGKVGNIVCGDVMWLYIKVGKNKKKQEIIKDVRFETFGCVAAIATSSAITDLIKGTTLVDALDFRREKIVKKLGGLPPIKLHCSVLAADALFEAIYDYYKKQKREIPEKLLKDHERIKEDREQIEKRYKKWTKLEEKMHRRK